MPDRITFFTPARRVPPRLLYRPARAAWRVGGRHKCWQCGLASINTAHAGPPAPGSARTRRLPLYVAYYRLALCRGRVGACTLTLHVQCFGCVAMMPQLAPPTPAYPAPSPRNPPHVPASSSLRAASTAAQHNCGTVGGSVEMGSDSEEPSSRAPTTQSCTSCPSSVTHQAPPFADCNWALFCPQRARGVGGCLSEPAAPRAPHVQSGRLSCRAAAADQRQPS